MADWWERNIGEPGKTPLLLLFLSFVVTFLATRTITRLIRAGRGPFHDVESEGGLHIHHSVPGIILLLSGAIMAVAARPGGLWGYVAAVAVGIGASLVLDEFALILHLDDVYWSEEGRASVQAVALVMACLALALVGFSPFGVDDVAAEEASWRWSATAVVLTSLLASVLCVAKGKYRLVLVAIFLPPVACLGALRLARPGSLWFRSYYARSPERAQRAVDRAARWDARVDPTFRWLGDVIAGSPTTTPSATTSEP